MSADKQRPTAIKIKSGSNISVRNNTVIGDMDLLDAEDVHNLDAVGNKLITPKNKTPANKKSWDEKPYGKVALTVIAALIVACLVYYFGWGA